MNSCAKKYLEMNRMHMPPTVLGGDCAKLQACPDECEESLLTSADWEYGKPQLYGRAVEGVQNCCRSAYRRDGWKSSTSTKTE
jgi:hypothetical protein